MSGFKKLTDSQWRTDVGDAVLAASSSSRMTVSLERSVGYGISVRAHDLSPINCRTAHQSGILLYFCT